jgi:hypothetical protein
VIALSGWKAATELAAASEPLCIARRSISCQHPPKFPLRQLNLTHNRLYVREVTQFPSSYIRLPPSWTPSNRLVLFSSLNSNNVFCTTLPKTPSP